ncbi:MAG: XrtA system polysaccharide deacetylase [Verrucomicrobiales bacterium]|nr:DUF3473 domain-containing protein [Nitrospinaceae bacterium]
MLNALTIDVEDYFMVSAFEDVVKFENWNRYESRVEKNTHRILDLLDEYDVKATFFVLGWVAEQSPKLVKEIYHRGHEVASHGYAHQLVYTQTPDGFREETRKAKNILEEITGELITGYRAASYSIIKKNIWALDILIEEGFQYDSSIFPIRHDRYGIPESQRFPYIINNKAGSIREYPLSTIRLYNKVNLPIAGGGYLRLFPYTITKWGIERLNLRENQPAIVYTHPWEIDPDQPRIRGKILSRLRHYTKLRTMEGTLRKLLADFKFVPIRMLDSKLSHLQLSNNEVKST